MEHNQYKNRPYQKHLGKKLRNLKFDYFDGGTINATFGGFLGKPVLKFDTNRPDINSHFRNTLSGREQSRSAELVKQCEKRVQNRCIRGIELDLDLDVVGELDG